MSKNTNKSGSKTPAKATPVKASAPAKKSYGTLIALIVVLVAAVAIIAVMNNKTDNINAQLDAKTTELANVQNNLDATIAAKKELEKQLSDAEEALDALEAEVKAREAALRARESARKQVLLRLSPTLWNQIAAWAEEDFRSINGQIEYLLTEAVSKRKK